MSPLLRQNYSARVHRYRDSAAVEKLAIYVASGRPLPSLYPSNCHPTLSFSDIAYQIRALTAYDAQNGVHKSGCAATAGDCSEWSGEGEASFAFGVELVPSEVCAPAAEHFALTAPFRQWVARARVSEGWGTGCQNVVTFPNTSSHPVVNILCVRNCHLVISLPSTAHSRLGRRVASKAWVTREQCGPLEGTGFKAPFDNLAPLGASEPQVIGPKCSLALRPIKSFLLRFYSS